MFQTGHNCSCCRNFSRLLTFSSTASSGHHCSACIRKEHNSRSEPTPVTALGLSMLPLSKHKEIAGWLQTHGYADTWGYLLGRQRFPPLLGERARFHAPRVRSLGTSVPASLDVCAVCASCVSGCAVCFSTDGLVACTYHSFWTNITQLYRLPAQLWPCYS